MDLELLKTLAPYFTSILGAVVAIGIAIFNNSSKAKGIQNKLSKVDDELHELKNNHFFHLGEYLKKLGKLMDEDEAAPFVNAAPCLPSGYKSASSCAGQGRCGTLP